MSLKNRINAQQGTLLDAAKSAVSDIQLQGSGVTSNETVKNLISLESLDSVNRANLGASLESAQQTIESAFGEQVSVENFRSPFADKETAVSEAQRLRNVALESGAVAALAMANPGAYARAAMSLESQAPVGGTLVTLPADGDAGSLGFSYSVANEAYDESELHKFQAYSIAFNTMAARQDAFGEGFYPTIVISADQAGCDLSVRRQRVYDEVRHALTGKATDFGFKNLLSAAIDPTILADESTKLVPYRDPTVAAPEALLNTDQFGQKSVQVAGVDVPTAPYKFGKSINVIGIAGYAPLVGAGLLDQTDSVAARASVSRVYMSGGENSGTDLPVVAFNTNGLFRSSFIASTEGRDKEMTLMFKFNDLVIDENTKAITGASVPAFSSIASGHLTVHASVTISGTLDLQFGTVTLNSSSVQVTKITDNTGASIGLSSGAGATAKAAVEGLGMVGYDLQAYRTNSNRRTAGKRLDVETIRERYTVLVQPPMTVQRPATVADGEAAELEALINAVRLRNSNNAVTALLNQAAILKSIVRGPSSPATAEIAGLGRLLVTPFYEELTLDMVQSMNSIKAHERAEDISATLVQALRDLLYRMYQYSGIQAALDAQNPTGNESPVVLIGTDQTIVRHLMVQGDTRTFGTMFQEARVVVSMDERIRNRIFVTFTRNKNLDQLDALRFGSHLWIPELVSRMPVSRNGATNMEAMVQTRNLQVSHLPILGQIKVLNMPTALVDKTLQPAIATNIDNPYLDGILFNTTP